MDLDQIERELKDLTNTHDEELIYMKYMHPRLYILVGHKLGWTEEEIYKFINECH